MSISYTNMQGKAFKGVWGDQTFEPLYYIGKVIHQDIEKRLFVQKADDEDGTKITWVGHEEVVAGVLLHMSNECVSNSNRAGMANPKVFAEAVKLKFKSSRDLVQLRALASYRTMWSNLFSIVKTTSQAPANAN